MGQSPSLNRLAARAANMLAIENVQTAILFRDHLKYVSKVPVETAGPLMTVNRSSHDATRVRA